MWEIGTNNLEPSVRLSIAGISKSLRTSYAHPRDSGSPYSANPNLHGFPSSSVALVHFFSVAAACILNQPCSNLRVRARGAHPQNPLHPLVINTLRYSTDEHGLKLLLNCRRQKLIDLPRHRARRLSRRRALRRYRILPRHRSAQSDDWGIEVDIRKIRGRRETSYSRTRAHIGLLRAGGSSSTRCANARRWRHTRGTTHSGSCAWGHTKAWRNTGDPHPTEARRHTWGHTGTAKWRFCRLSAMRDKRERKGMRTARILVHCLLVMVSNPNGRERWCYGLTRS